MSKRKEASRRRIRADESIRSRKRLVRVSEGKGRREKVAKEERRDLEGLESEVRAAGVEWRRHTHTSQYIEYITVEDGVEERNRSQPSACECS